MNEAPPKVFISYSHDSPEHKEWVLDLADRLREDGIDAEVDQYVPSPPEGWPAWCEQKIEAADFVLLVCTETYHRRVKGGEEPGKGLGVVWEARIIRQLVYDSGAASEKFIPVLSSNGSDEHIPLPVKCWTRYVLDTEDGYDALYRRLTKQPWVTRGRVGSRRRLPSRPPRRRPGSGGASGAPRSFALSGRCRQWAKLLDRDAQEVAIGQRLQAMRRSSGRFEPLLVVIPGCASACHEHFVERVSWYDLRLVVSEDEQPPRYEQLIWRSAATEVFMLLRDLRERLEALTAARDIETLEARLLRLGRSLCFSFSITDADWRANRPLVRDWIDYFCRRWPAPADDHLVIGFLCVEVPETRSGLMSWINRLKPRVPGSLATYLEELKDRSASESRLLVTESLEPIRRQHVMDWIGKVRNFLPDPEQVDDLREMCRGLFPQPSASRSFVEVHLEILDILHELTGAGRPPGVFVR